jgi:hypothetical protein
MKTDDSPQLPLLPTWIMTPKVGSKRRLQIAYTRDYLVIQDDVDPKSAFYEVWAYEWKTNRVVLYPECKRYSSRAAAIRRMYASQTDYRDFIEGRE